MNGFISAVVECVLFNIDIIYHKYMFPKRNTKMKEKKWGYFNLETKSVSATVSFVFSISFLAGDWL